MDGSRDRDEWLMAQVARGDRSSLETLVRRHATPLLTFLTRLSGDPHGAEELFQEVFLTVWLKRSQYQFPRPFRPWLYTIAANKCHASRRSRRLLHALPSEDGSEALTDQGARPEEALVTTETSALVAAAVARLPAQQRTVVVLRLWEGLSYAEIAEVVGRTEATVRSHMHHGLVALRQDLGPRLG